MSAPGDALRTPPRHGSLLRAAILTLLALALFVFVTRPLAQQHARIERVLAERSAQLAWMREAVPQLQARTPAARAAVGGTQEGSALAIVERSARAASIAITRMQPEGESGVRISFEQVSFDTLIEWLAALEAGHALRAHTLQLERIEAPGRVSGEVLLGDAGTH